VSDLRAVGGWAEIAEYFGKSKQFQELLDEEELAV